MAAGDITFFDDAIGWLGTEVFQLNTDTLKLLYTEDEVVLASTTAAPAYGEGLTVDLSDSEVSGGSASAGGADITNTYSESTGTGTLDATNVDLEQNASNPSAMRYAPVYSEEATNNEGLFFVDLGANIDGTAGDLAITWNGSGIATLAQA